MNGLGVIACGAGLQDGLNPCMFMTCAFFIAHGLWLVPRSLRINGLRIIFVLGYALSFLEFNFGHAQILVLRKDFILAAKIIYLIFGAGAFILGLLFLKEWYLDRQGLPASAWVDKRMNPFKGSGLVVRLMTGILVSALSALATIGPINNYILLLGNVAIMKGQWQTLIPLLAGYVLFSMWPLWLVWAFLSIKNLRPSLLKIVYAAIFFTASSCVLLIFIK
jgi:hypothetical protein